MEDVRDVVREKYGDIAKNKTSCCGPENSCCGTGKSTENMGIEIGYTMDDLELVPTDSNLGLGCGNPLAFSSLKKGDVVLDLGAGGGMDCFLAAQRVGEKGKVIGVDMTSEMVSLARQNAAKGQNANVEFRLGEIENLPVADHTIDVILSNCVINLSPNKPRVFQEAYRVLKPGGRFMISDIVLLEPLPQLVRESIDAYIGCIAGAVLKDDYIKAIEASGFVNVKVVDEQAFDILSLTTDPFVQSLIEKFGLSLDRIRHLSASIVSMKIEGRKPV